MTRGQSARTVKEIKKGLKFKRQYKYGTYSAGEMNSRCLVRSEELVTRNYSILTNKNF